jgi:Zn-dependent peptidase ImmA (M78 family)
LSIKAPYLPYEKLRPVAQNFLTTHHPSGVLPIPIEEIIEFQFQMEIIPISGLLRSHAVDSAITNDLTTIYVDAGVYEKSPRRYRYSLAHELSHKLIHYEIFTGLQCDNIDEYKAAITSIPADQYSWIEQQAYNLAGLILVPSDHLESAYTQADTTASQAGISLQDLDTKELKDVCHHIGIAFEVSGDVIRKRLKYDNIIG